MLRIVYAIVFAACLVSFPSLSSLGESGKLKTGGTNAVAPGTTTTVVGGMTVNGKGRATTTVGGVQAEKGNGGATTTVGGVQAEKVKGGATTTVGGVQAEKVKGGATTTVGSVQAEKGRGYTKTVGSGKAESIGSNRQ